MIFFISEDECYFLLVTVLLLLNNFLIRRENLERFNAPLVADKNAFERLCNV